MRIFDENFFLCGDKSVINFTINYNYYIIMWKNKNAVLFSTYLFFRKINAEKRIKINKTYKNGFLAKQDKI